MYGLWKQTFDKLLMIATSAQIEGLCRVTRHLVQPKDDQTNRQLARVFDLEITEGSEAAEREGGG